jgi:hypothetical protein
VLVAIRAMTSACHLQYGMLILWTVEIHTEIPDPLAPVAEGHSWELRVDCLQHQNTGSLLQPTFSNSNHLQHLTCFSCICTFLPFLILNFPSKSRALNHLFVGYSIVPSVLHPRPGPLRGHFCPWLLASRSLVTTHSILNFGPVSPSDQSSYATSFSCPGDMLAFEALLYSVLP